MNRPNGRTLDRRRETGWLSLRDNNLYRTMRGLEALRPDVRVRYRNLPLPFHEHARQAALAAECAGQSGRFAKAHDLLFSEPESLGVRSWGRFAKRLGLSDSTGFAVCVRDSLPVGRINADEEAAKRLGIRVTPTILVDSVEVDGAPPNLTEFIALLKRKS